MAEAKVDTKEVELAKQQATKALTAANEMVIASEEDMVKATDVLSKIKSVAKLVKSRKEAITKPLNEALASARDLFRPIEDDATAAERVIKGKMLDWQNAEEKRKRIEEDRIANRVEKGTMKPQTALKKLGEIAPVATTTKGKVGEVKTMLVKKYRITDEAKIPREYLVPDMAKIKEALKAGTVVPGAEAYEEKVIAAS